MATEKTSAPATLTSAQRNAFWFAFIAGVLALAGAAFLLLVLVSLYRGDPGLAFVRVLQGAGALGTALGAARKSRRWARS